MSSINKIPITITLDIAGHLSPYADLHIPFLLKSLSVQIRI